MLREGAEPLLKQGKAGTSLAVQWVRISLLMQGTWVRFLVRELRSLKPCCLFTWEGKLLIGMSPYISLARTARHGFTAKREVVKNSYLYHLKSQSI